IPASASSGPTRASGSASSSRTVATAPACVCITLFGSPVVPLELISIAVGDDEARAGLAQERGELARGQQRAGGRERQAGEQRAVRDDGEVGPVGGDDRQHVARTG